MLVLAAPPGSQSLKAEAQRQKFGMEPRTRTMRTSANHLNLKTLTNRKEDRELRATTSPPNEQTDGAQKEDHAQPKMNAKQQCM